MFNNYNHFKNYCLKVASNREYEVDEKEKNVIVEFENVFNLIEELKNKKIIEYKVCILDAICNEFKAGKFYDAFKHMDYFIRKVDNFKSKDMFDIYYILKSLNTVLKMEIDIVEDFVFNRLEKDSFYLEKVEVIEVLEATEKIHICKNIDFDYTDKFGIYFIYDVNDELAYIGKSTSCLLRRSIQSSEQRKLLNFSRIEFRECKTKSDVGIYEAYYIAKYKPRYNSEFVFDDDITFELPKLQVSKTIDRNINSDYIEYSYKYIQTKCMLTEKFLKEKDNRELHLLTCNNIKKLNDKGIYDKYQMSQVSYKKALMDNKDKCFALVR